MEQKWQSFPCDTHMNVVCFVDKLTVVHERKTWEEALEHCRSLKKQCTVNNGQQKCTLQHDLVTLSGQSDYSHVRKRINNVTDEVWIGLRFLGGQWWWMKGEPVTVIEGLPHCPDHLSSCGTFSKTTGRISFTDCSKKLQFICQKAK
uniref:C-type lectin domain-containing protein n=1 Tax=Knipowitschia caucasica TaxID=637954 RepID=A0AAV2MBE4_KNICA